MNTAAVAVASIIALAAMVLRPRLGILLIFLVRPLVDTTWDAQALFGLKLTEIVSAAVPLIVIVQMLARNGSASIAMMPLRAPWFSWVGDVFLFSSIIMFDSGMADGSQVLFRHLNGFAGFYMVQACYNEREDVHRFGWVLLLASIVPIAMGVIEGATGHHWRVTLGENGVIRNTGLYHDVITIRYYALQGLMGAFLVSQAGRKTPRPLAIALVLYALAALFVVKGAYSKSGVAIVGAWALLWPVVTRQYRILLVFAGGALLAAAYYSKEIMDSVGFVFVKELAVIQGSGSVQHTLAGRWYIWDEAMAAWSQQGAMGKMFGSGHEGLGLHNDFLQILVHGGIVGLAIYVALLLCLGVRVAGMIVRRRDALAAASAMLLVMWLVDAIGLVPSAYSGYQWFVWGTMAMCMRVGSQEARAPATHAAAPVARAPANLMA